MGYFQVGKFNGGSESIAIQGLTSRDEPGLQARDALAGDRMRGVKHTLVPPMMGCICLKNHHNS